MNNKERLIEMYVGYGDSSGGTWVVWDVYIDSGLSEEKAIEAAYSKVYSFLDGREETIVAFVGLYCYWNDELMEELWDEEEE